MMNFSFVDRMIRNHPMKTFAFGVSLVVGVIAFPSFFYTHMTVEEHTITVTDKERVCSTTDGNRTCKYLVFTENNGTFENTDSIWHFKFDSSDVYGNFVTGNTYEVVDYGWRIPLFSVYPNIVEVNEVTSD